MQHFVAIGEFKLELQSGKAQSGSKSTICISSTNCISSVEITLFLLADILLQHRSLFQCDLEIWRMTFKNNRAPLLCYFKLCAAFCSHWWIQTGVTVQKHPIWVKIDNFFSRVTLKFDGCFQKQKGTSPKHYQAICILSSTYVYSNWSYSPETPNLGQIRRFLELRDLEIWRMTFKNYRAPLLCSCKFCTAFCSHWWIQTGVTVRKRPIWVKFDDF